MTERKESQARSAALPLRHGRPWSPGELAELIQGIARGLDLEQLMNSHQRTRSSISAAVARLLPEHIRPASRINAIAALARHLLDQQQGQRPSHHEESPSPTTRVGYFIAEPEVFPPTPRDGATREVTPSVDRTDIPMLVSVAITSLGSDRDRIVLELRLGIDGRRQTLARIGKTLGISAERVRQIQERALRKLAARARHDGTAGAALRRLMTDARAQSGKIPIWLLEVAQNGFEVSLALALKFILRASGFPKQEVDTTIALLVELERSRKAELPTFTAADKVERKVNQWLSHCDWPSHTSPPPPAALLSAQREVGESDIAGTFLSAKLGRLVQFESGLELAVMSLLEKSMDVAYYQEQPAAIRYGFGDRHYSYYPDLLVATRDGRCLLVEVKPTAHMALSINRAKARAARAWAHARGWGWLVVNDKHTYRQIAQHELSTGKKESLDNELRERGSITWRDTPSVRARFGLTALELTAYIIQSGADLDRSYRITSPRSTAL